MKVRKRIRVDQLKPGMFVVGMDQPWYKTPYLLHHFLVQSNDTITELARHGVQEVTIDPAKGLDVVEDAQAQDPKPDAAAASGAEQVAPASSSTESPPHRDARRNAISRVDQLVYQEAEAAIERVFEEVNGGELPSAPALKSVVGRFFSRVLQDRTAMMTQVMLQQMRRFDRSLASHAVDTCILSLIFASEYGISQDDMEQVGMGALLHDVGYVRLPRNLYRARHQLAVHEEELMQQHPRLGHTMLASAKDLPDTVRQIIVEHHERIDGSGYPARLSGAALSAAGQLVGLVDTYESLVTFRAGHVPLSPFQAIRNLFMLGERRTFDKALVEVAIKCLGVYPIGSVVKLNTGERAIVVGVHPEHRLKPVLKVIIGPRGEYYPTPIVVNLAESGDIEAKRTILTALDPTTEQINVAMYLDSTAQEHAA
jgi:putative nucleotidyltransferase with HDIG domain